MTAATAVPRPDGRRARAAAGAVRARVARQRNVPWIVAGVLLLVGSSLTFSVWASSLGDRTPVVALARAVTPGVALTSDDLTVVQVAADTPLPLLAAADRETLLGQVALSALPAGTLLGPDMVGDAPDVRPGEAVVGMALPPGALPVATLHPGAPVLAVEVPAPGDVEAASGQQVWAGTVFEVTTTDDPAAPGGLVVSLLVDQVDAPAVAGAAAAERVRLVLVHSRDDIATLLAEFAAVPPVETPPEAP